MKTFWRKLRQGLDRAIYEGRFKQFVWLSGVLILAFLIVLLLAAVFRFDLVAAAPGVEVRLNGFFVKSLILSSF